MGNKDKAKKRRKGGPNKFQKTRGNRRRLPDDPADVIEVVSPPTEPADIPSSASAKKINASSDADACSGDNELEYSFHYLIIDCELLQGIIDVVGKCPRCKESGLVVSNNLAEKKGLSNLLLISCTSCDYVLSTYTSQHIPRPNTRGQKPFDINARAIIAFREIGKGHAAMEQLFGLMNFLPIMGKDSFQQMNGDIGASYSRVAKQCMLEAANELHADPVNENDLLVDVGVSCDGTWQKRGFSSLLGAATVISMDIGKCIDYAVLSKKCSICTYWESRKDTEGYEKFMNDIQNSHECSKNHEGSAGAMEVAGILQVF